MIEAQDSTVIGACGEDNFVQQAMALAAQCGIAPQGTGSPTPGCVGPRKGTIGSALTALGAGLTVEIQITVRKGTFVGNRLKVSKGAAVNDLLITDVQVGGTSIMLSSDPLETAVSDPANCPGGVALPFLPAPVSQVISVFLKNTTNASISRIAHIEGVML